MVTALALSVALGLQGSSEAKQIWSLPAKDKYVIASGESSFAWVLRKMGAGIDSNVERLDLYTGVVTPFRDLKAFREGETLALNSTTTLVLRSGSLRLEISLDSAPSIGKRHLVWDSGKRRLALELGSGRLVEMLPGTERAVRIEAIPRPANGDGLGYLVGDPDSGYFAVTAKTRSRVRAKVFGPNLKPSPIPVAFIYSIEGAFVLGAPDAAAIEKDAKKESEPGALTLWNAKTGKVEWERPGLRDAYVWGENVVVLKPEPLLLSAKTGQTLGELPSLKGVVRLRVERSQVWMYRTTDGGPQVEGWSMPGLRVPKETWVP